MQQWGIKYYTKERFDLGNESPTYDGKECNIIDCIIDENDIQLCLGSLVELKDQKYKKAYPFQELTDEYMFSYLEYS